MDNSRRIIFWGLLASFALIASGCILAMNSCAKSHNDEPNLTPGDPNLSIDPVISHYPDLDNVEIPKSLPQQIKDYNGFKVSFNKENHTPNYVAWELLGSEVTNLVDRSDYFWQDAEIEGCPAYKDYTGSGYDRGHMCPAADQKWSEEAMWDCFVMANMCPQDHNLNAGAWETLESKSRQWAKRDSAIMIIAGPIYDGNDQKRIGNIGVRVPDAFFKALLAPYVSEPRAIAFVYPNMTSPGNMSDYAMSIDDLEELIGFDLFSALPDDLEKKVEAKFSFTEWNRSN